MIHFCVKCRREMRCDKNEVYVVSRPVPTEAGQARSGDRWKCPGCGVEIVSGFGNPISASGITADYEEATE